MDSRCKKLLPAALVLVVLSFSCRGKLPLRSHGGEDFPHIILWAWERPEDLEFIDSQRFGVAFLAQTLILKGDEVIFNPRHQPLKVSPQTRLIAVTRIESQTTTGERATLSPAQNARLMALILKTVQLTNVRAIQIDFDAAKSEREFYRGVLGALRKQLPDNVPLSMTALASFCLGDRWLEDVAVDEVVPMIFRMGTDDGPIKTFLAAGNDFNEPICRKSYGIALDEPLQMKLDSSRRIYVFNVRAWSEKDLTALQERFPQ